MSRPTPSGRRLRSIVAATSGVTIALAGIGVTTLPAAAASPPETAPPAAAAAGSSHTVTLITGDRVKVTEVAAGKQTVEVTTAQPGAGFQTYEAAGDLHVIPDGATAYVAAGVLDPDLFNVSLLIEYGYDDASVAATPIIVQQDAATARTFSAPLPGLEVQAELPSIDAAAATLQHADAAAAWQALMAPTGAQAFSAEPSLAGGITAIHLDGKVKATLDSSVPFIDAPAAWAEGFTGEGVTVAVLDTGIDDTHPDLQGHISPDSKSFVPGEDVDTDQHGHGTHVASTVAGTGAASGGTHRGVADGAQLLIGKVLGGSDGSGQDSWIIEAMEWAGEHAPIVSMSLGSYGASDGKDLMAESLNQIAIETGALFVVAAGNNGAPESVGSPGSAEQALTVGSVDDPSGALSYFSSQGPLSRSGAMKPDLTGPGNDVTAARSADSAGEGSYITMSGTSMATPHVAGAAAIVKQKHPEYTAAQLRAALVSTTTDVGYTSYQGGAGVVDVKAAIDAPVIAAGSGDFGMLMWGEEATPVTRTIEYTNRSDAEVTVALAATLADTTPRGDTGPGPLSVDAAFEALTMDVDSLAIPAGETRSVAMTVDPGKVPAGTQLSGTLVGSIDGTPVTRTALGTIAEAERYDIKMTATDFTGEPTLAYAWVWNSDTEVVDPIAVEGETTIRVMKGNYSVMSYMELDRTPDAKAEVLVGDPHITLDQNVSVALDARTAKQVTLDIGKKGLEETFRRMDFTADGLRGSAIMPVKVDEMWAQPMKPNDADVDFTTRWRLMKPMLTVAAGKKPLDIIIQAGSTFLDGKLTGKAVNAGKGSVAEVQAADVSGKIAVVTRSDEVSSSQRVANAVAAGAKMVVVANDADGEISEWVGSADYESSSPVPVAAISGVEGRALLADMAEKAVTLDAVGVPYTNVLYDIARFTDGEIPANLHYAPKKLTRVDTTYYGKKEDMGEFRADFAPKVGYSGGYPMRALRGTTREEWVNTDQVQWNQSVMILDDMWEMRDTLRSYKAGQRIKTGYYGGIVRPYVATGYWVPYRQSAFAQVNVPGWGDGIDSAHTGSFDTYAENAPVQQLTDVYIDGVQLAASKYQGANVSEIPDGTHNWRVVSTATHDGSHIPSSTKTVSEWNFTATGAVDDYATKRLAMIQAYYDVDIAKDGRAGTDRRKGSPVTIGLELGHVAGTDPAGKITSATLEARTTGGKWAKVVLKSAATDAPTGAVANDGDIFVTSRAYVSGYTGKIPVADTGGWIDLRVTAKDAAGNTFSQEITKAFQAAPAKGSAHWWCEHGFSWVKGC
ncbi:S8 family serine peptidase [Microbacterium pumilum]|uniref:S8 family serine peptidase n=1 Tax=Microbacterium pumilum TaxID=344165 RepID=A0ABN2SUU8_9MICO